MKELARFTWRTTNIMRKYILIAYILLLTLTLGANPAQVSITLTTSVPGYLLHGFLTAPATPTFETNPSVNDAFNPAGAVLNYGIKTNVGVPLIVKATIDPFEEQDVVTPATVPIDQVKIDGNLILRESGKYKILDFTPSSGTIFYAYTLTVYVDQSILNSKPVGSYVSNVAIDIETGS